MSSAYPVFLFICVFFLHSCGTDEKTSAGLDDPFLDELRITLLEIETMSDVYTLSPPVLSPLRVLAVPDSDLLIVADAADWSVRLFDQHGVEQSKVGGKGRGPGEFEVINQLHIDHDKRLYVLDLRLNRVNVFDIDNESQELAYSTTIAFEHASNLHLQTIYVYEDGSFGVFNRLDDYQTWDNSFHLYRLDQEFRPVEHLLEIPGNEKTEIFQGAYIDHPLGSLNFWDFHDAWFYYITSYSPEITKLNLETGELETVQYFSLEERLNAPHHINFIKNRLEVLIEGNPPVGEAIEESRTLPLFRNLVVLDKQILFDTYYAGGGYGVIIYVDKETEEVKYIKKPPYFSRFSLRDQVVYGIDFTDPDEEYQVMFIKLNP